MGLSFTKKSFFYQKIDLPKISYKYGQYFDLVHAHKPCFLLPLSFPFPLPFYSRYLLRFIFFLAAVKSWVLDKAWKWDRDQLQV